MRVEGSRLRVVHRGPVGNVFASGIRVSPSQSTILLALFWFSSHFVPPAQREWRAFDNNNSSLRDAKLHTLSSPTKPNNSCGLEAFAKTDAIEG